MPTQTGDAVVLDPDTIADGTDPLGVGTGDAPPGTYALVFEVGPTATITVGALGSETVPSGAYAYVGSAFGSNGLGRIDRHRRVAAGVHDTTHWHVDYLGSHPNTSLTAVVASPHADIECRLATALRRELAATDDATATPVAGFGASDCDCSAHLVGGDDPETVRAAVVESMQAVTPSTGSEEE
jgi:Uri superfamily endonuclease